MLKRVVLPIAIILIAISVFIALKQSKPVKAKLEKPEKVWRVNTVDVEFQSISPQITVYGRVETPRKASLNAAITADVKQVNVLEGDVVQQGYILISLDDSDAQLLLQQREADLTEIEASISAEKTRYKRDKTLLVHENELLDLTEKAVTRAKKLEETRLLTRSSLDEAVANKQRQVVTVKRLNYDIAEHPTRLAVLKAKYNRAEALLGQAKLDIARSQITAPFSGRIAKLDVSIGDRVRIGDGLLSIYDLNNLELRAQIPGRYLKEIRQNLQQGKEVHAKAVLDDKTLDFVLTRLSGETREDSGGVDGLFTLKGNSHLLTLGTFLELSLELTSEQDVVEIPFNALYGLNRVYRIKEGYLEAVRIERIGEHQSSDDTVKLLIRSDDLKDGDNIVTTQLPNAMTGLRVEALND